MWLMPAKRGCLPQGLSLRRQTSQHVCLELKQPWGQHLDLLHASCTCRRQLALLVVSVIVTTHHFMSKISVDCTHALKQSNSLPQVI